MLVLLHVITQGPRLTEVLALQSCGSLGHHSYVHERLLETEKSMEKFICDVLRDQA